MGGLENGFGLRSEVRWKVSLVGFAGRGRDGGWIMEERGR